jgi:hypothetical protein
LEIASQSRLEWLGTLPLSVLLGKNFDAIECEGKLDVNGLFGPQGPVIVEYSDALVRRDVIGGCWISRAFYEFYDRSFVFAVIPGGKRIFQL